MSFLKNLENKLLQIRNSLDKNTYDTVDILCEDETRFGLITKQKRVIAAKGIKPIGKYKHSYKYKWLWGSFSLTTGESFCMTTDEVNKDFFIKYLEDLSKEKPREIKILIIDNAAFHSTKDITLPDNIKLLPIPPYCPELNPAERVWQWMKDKTAMKIYDTISDLEVKIEKLITQLDYDIIKSITGYQFYIDALNNVFKV